MYKKTILCLLVLSLLGCASKEDPMDIQAASFINKVAPIYPATALASNTEGYVLISYTVTPEGLVVAPKVTDSQQKDSEVTVTLTSVSSSEPDNGMGDGDTENDIQGVDAGADDFEFLLRAERMGPGRGRVYTIEYHAVDDSGNTADATGTILVPHDMGNKDDFEMDRN